MRCLMEVSKQLKKQIVIEVIALLFLVAVIIYAFFAIDKAQENKVSSIDGMVVVVDDTKNKKIEVLSDGAGLETEGTTYTITNNNKKTINYKLVVVPNEHDENILNQIRISTDDLYIENLTDLERYNGGYVINTHTLESGYTKIHLIKFWYKLEAKDMKLVDNIKFEYKLIKED